ncbi:Ppx/GppA phosphatase family protein [Altericista sp. CCNU0014]|uniref:Ppx/GppA phosphatase family protein n=1 Tax=Altericista sp. CCNU0014 TaxID=3082949 RepID=UPI0038500B6B
MTAELITDASVASSLATADPKSRILAAIDIGTNSVHMVVVRINPELPAFNIVDAEKSTVRLGERCPQTGNLTAEAMARAIAALRRCLDMAKIWNAEQVIAVATSATREAPNGKDFIKEVEAQLGLQVDLISGQEEARRIYLGVLSGLEFNHQLHTIIDIGGGSTELILGDGHDPRFLSSTKVGAVRLTAGFVTTDPINNREFDRLQAYVRGMLEWPLEDLKAKIEPGETVNMVGTSGTIESLIRLDAYASAGAPPATLSGYILTLERLQALNQRLRKLSFADRCKMPGMSERRAEIILAGGVILQEVMENLGMTQIQSCSRALREGIIVDWMLNHGLIEDRLRYQGSVRQRSALNMAQKYRVNLDNARQVAQFAVDLFDQTRGTLHQWDARERDLLWAAAILHNSGHYISHSAHHKHSYYLIRNGGLLGYTDAEIEIIANLARYHRKGAPKKKHESYQGLGKLERQTIDQLSALLKVAVALDRRQINAIQGLYCAFNPVERELHLTLIPARAEDDCSLELWSLEYKKACLEAEFGIKLVVRVGSTCNTEVFSAVR